MGFIVVNGAQIICHCGTEPSRLSVPPTSFSPPDLSLDRPTLDFSLTLPAADFSLALSFTMPKAQVSLVAFPEFGIFEEFHANGNLAIQANFEFGLLEGPCLVFDMDGKVVAHLNFHLGVLEGLDLSTPKLRADFDVDFEVDLIGPFAASNPIASIHDHIPHVNIHPFGLCKSSGNPEVKTAGKPVPCKPKTETPWILGSKIKCSRSSLSGGGSLSSRILNDSSILTCAYGCVITVVDPGQSIVTV